MVVLAKLVPMHTRVPVHTHVPVHAHMYPRMHMYPCMYMRDVAVLAKLVDTIGHSGQRRSCTKHNAQLSVAFNAQCTLEALCEPLRRSIASVLDVKGGNKQLIPALVHIPTCHDRHVAVCTAPSAPAAPAAVSGRSGPTPHTIHTSQWHSMLNAH